MDNIEQLEKEIALLKELIELKEKVKEYEVAKIEYVPFYIPGTTSPYNPFWNPWGTWV